MKEFNLSEKRKELREDLINANWAKNTINAIVDEVEKQDKEFIKEIKKTIKEGVERNNVLPLDWCFDRIDKLAGDKLK